MSNFDFLEIPELTVDRVVPGEGTTDDIDVDCRIADEGGRCPICHRVSTRVHSEYLRVIQDVPVSGRTVWLHLRVRKFFCTNDACQLKIFREPLAFVTGSSRRTDRLNETILHMVSHLSANSSVKVLHEFGIQVHKSSICNLLTANRAKS